jgi:YgiT-type zinc finger domain-containing protein
MGVFAAASSVASVVQQTAACPCCQERRGWRLYRRDGILSGSCSLERRLQGQEETMSCVACKQSETHPGITAVVCQRGETTVVVKKVPAAICDTCEEYYLSEDISARVLALAENAVAQRAEIDVLRVVA